MKLTKNLVTIASSLRPRYLIVKKFNAKVRTVITISPYLLMFSFSFSFPVSANIIESAITSIKLRLPSSSFFPLQEIIYRTMFFSRKLTTD